MTGTMHHPSNQSPGPLGPLRRLLPWRVRHALDTRSRRRALPAAVRSLERVPCPGRVPDSALAALHHAWGNEDWSAEPCLLREVADALDKTDGAVLECGSGVSTLLLAARTLGTGRRVVTLEHEPAWAERVAAELARTDMTHVELQVAPLRPCRSGAGEWYDVSQVAVPEQGFGLVVCDGPPGETEGGRAGLFGEMAEAFADDCLILVDDMHREPEQQMVDGWMRTFAASLTLEASTPKQALLRVRRSAS